MKYLMLILLCSCTVARKPTVEYIIVDGSGSEGNIVKYQWNGKVKGVRDTLEAKNKIQLIVTDNKGRKDTAYLK